MVELLPLFWVDSVESSFIKHQTILFLWKILFTHTFFGQKFCFWLLWSYVFIYFIPLLWNKFYLRIDLSCTSCVPLSQICTIYFCVFNCKFWRIKRLLMSISSIWSQFWLYCLSSHTLHSIQLEVEQIVFLPTTFVIVVIGCREQLLTEKNMHKANASSF